MAYVRIVSGRYIAVINEEEMIEIKTNDKEKAKEIAENLYGKDVDIRVCKIPSMVNYVDPEHWMYKLTYNKKED